ncbi:uncharacterized protein [Rutidosis leptorrhynchoides]|uniref:uncharacterized protein n=1 Tax=Rutidosis leptorrhynchoides TaxID=125765 RepID=UPI003A99669E
MARLELFNLFCIKTMWGNYAFDFACSLSRGMSGGIISVWDPNFFVKERVWLLVFMSTHNGEYVIFGDMNEVRCESERFGSSFNRENVNAFNNFIGNAGLEEVGLSGRRFTWMNKAASKMSRIDRVFVSQNVTETISDLKLIALDRAHSDHFPLMLHNTKVDFRPIPFKFFHSWVKMEGIENLIHNCVESEVYKSAGNMHEKLKLLKSNIKEWVNQKRLLSKSRCNIIQ